MDAAISKERALKPTQVCIFGKVRRVAVKAIGVTMTVQITDGERIAVGKMAMVITQFWFSKVCLVESQN